MDREFIIKNALIFAEKLFSGENSGHDFEHTVRVYKMAVRLAEKENADPFITALAAILHDTDDAKLFPETAGNKTNAVCFLMENGADEEDIEKIIKIIKEVSFIGTDSPVPSSTEGKCVQDADRLDAIGAVGIARTFAFGASRGRKMYDPDIKPLLNASSKDYLKQRENTTFNHFYEKLFLLKGMMNTDSAREIAENRDKFMREFADEFLKEWNGEA